MTDNQWPDTACHLRFVGRYVDLTGKNTVNCQFDNCTIELRKDPLNTRIVNNIFQGCVFVGDGWPDQWPGRRSEG